MFDEITVKKPLPLPKEVDGLNINWNEMVFQTKDLESCLSEYIISEDGFLYIKKKEYVPYTEEELKTKKGFSFIKEIVDKGLEKIEHHGVINFYCYEKFDENNDFWMDFYAYFIYGKLDKIEFKEFKKQASSDIRLNKFLEQEEKENKKPWNIFKKYARKIGWSFFWNKVLKFLYSLSNCILKFRSFIIRNII